MTDLAVLYEHDQWFDHMFGVLRDRGLAVADLRFDDAVVSDPTAPSPAPVIFNRMSMSAPNRRARHGLFHARALLVHWAHEGVRVINGFKAFGYDLSKASQLSLIHKLGLTAPATRVIHRPEDAVEAAAQIGFPILIKANVGGAGVGIVAYEDAPALIAAVNDGSIPFGVDGVALVQRKLVKRGDAITRVECLNGEALYAVDVVTPGDVFDLCPADVCQPGGEGGGPVFRQAELPAAVASEAETIVAAAGIDVGGVEFLIDDATGERVYYDVNAMSNYVGDWSGVLGWDPHQKLADYLIGEIERARNGAESGAPDPV